MEHLKMGSLVKWIGERTMGDLRHRTIGIVTGPAGDNGKYHCNVLYVKWNGLGTTIAEWDHDLEVISASR